MNTTSYQAYPLLAEVGLEYVKYGLLILRFA